MNAKSKNGRCTPGVRPFIGMAGLTAGLALAVFSFPGTATAQYSGWGGYYGAPPLPPGAYGYPYGPGPGPGPDARPEPGRSDAPLPSASVQRIANQQGLRLVTAPRRKGRTYLAEAEDRRGERHRLVVDAYRGTLLQDVRLGPKEGAPPARKAARPAPADAMKPPAADAPRPAAPAPSPDEAKIAPAPAPKPVTPAVPDTPAPPRVVAPAPVTAAPASPAPDAGAAAAVVAPAPPPPPSETPAPAPAPGGEEAK